VLDLCAGTLDLAAEVQKHHPKRLVAADFAADMLEAGKHKVPGAERVVADAMAMPFENAEFSRVICGFGMRNLADTHKGAREVRRVLEPRGVFVTLELFRPTRMDTRLFHAAYARYVLPTVGALVSGRREAYSYLRDSMSGFFTRTEYEDILRDSGFVNVTGHDLLFGIAAIVRAETPDLGGPA
jgi:demethylmenaquinone methyltransferase/2-methoxy-6-polyprenyl-1,4-benzoquinol methylase